MNRTSPRAARLTIGLVFGVVLAAAVGPDAPTAGRPADTQPSGPAVTVEINLNQAAKSVC